MKVIKSHGLWRKPVICDFPLLHAFMKVTAHVTNVSIKKSWNGEPTPRYEPCNYGPHDEGYV